MATMSSRTQIALSVMTQRQTCGPQKALCHTSYLTMALCRWSVFPTDPTHHELHSIIYMGKCFSSCSSLPFFHDSVVSNYRSGKSFQTHWILSHSSVCAKTLWHVKLTLTWIKAELSWHAEVAVLRHLWWIWTENPGDNERHSSSHSKQLFSHIHDSKSFFHKSLHSFYVNYKC